MSLLNHAMSVRSDFSIGESMLQMGQIVERAKECGYTSVALVDKMSIHGMVDFSVKANKAGIKPIVGCTLRVYDDPTYRKPSKASGIKEVDNPMVCIKAYALNATGVSSLMRLLTKANSEQYFYYHSRTGWDDVLEMEGVAISTGDMGGLFHHKQAREKLEALISKFGKDKVFVELAPINTPLFDTLNKKALTAAIDLDAETLVTYPVMYLEDEDASTLDVLQVITTQSKMSVPYRPKQYVKDFSFKDPNSIIERVKAARERSIMWHPVLDSGRKWARGLSNISRLADMCEYSFEKMPVSLPKMADNEFETLAKKCTEGWKKRFSRSVLGYMPTKADMPVYMERLKYELSVLKKMGFSGYFLLVEDLVRWSKESSIIVGPGRGSVGGSLVAYLLGITEVDPIRFNLLFERFINPERLDLPDADLDFMSSRRHEIVEYLIGKYGKDRVAGISNYATLASASALRDTGRVHDMTGLELTATKLVPKEHGQSFTLTEAAKAVPDIEKFKDANKDIWNHAIKLEGCMRSFGKHAAGVIVAGEPLINRAVVEARDSEEVPVVAWDKRVVEDFGLVKMDILGLSTLDVLEIAKQYIQERHGKTIDYTDLPLEDEKTMDAFGRGDTKGVFQFESPGMQKLLRDLAKGGRLTFDDLAAATALYRPGPMDSGLMDDFVQIKQGNRDPYYDHPNMMPALKDTYSVIVYQEQVMQLAVDLAGFTKAEADHLRKAMGKKDKDKMATMRQQWIDGCQSKSGMNDYIAGSLFDKIEAFAGYGFNKSHAVEYSVISVWTMWVRVNYPAEYFAACMSIVDDEKLPGLVKDAREYGIEVYPPDVNLSSEKFVIQDNDKLIAPFSRVMGCSDNTARRIVEARNRNTGWRLARVKKKRDGTEEKVYEPDPDSPVKGRFDTAEEFELAAASPGSKISSRVVENLRAVGALAHIEAGSRPPKDMSRRKDQIELMPGLIIDALKADRSTDVSHAFVKSKLIHIIQDYRSCEGCDLKNQTHPVARCKNDVKFMVVSDCPSWQEEKAGKMLEGDAAAYMKIAMSEAGVQPSNGYFTALVKAKKNDKFLTNAQINGCSQFLERELEVVKPAVIVALGSASIKRFVPGMKGGSQEMAGKVIYDSKLDASIVCGINPAQIMFDESKMASLQETFNKVAEILS